MRHDLMASKPKTPKSTFNRRQRHDRFAQNLRRGPFGQNRNTHRQRQHRARPAPERTAERIARATGQQAAPQTAQRHRNHRHRQSIDKYSYATAKFIKFAGIGQSPLRKNTNQFSVMQGLSNVGISLFHQSWIIAGRSNRDRLCFFENPKQQRNVENFLIHDESNRTRTRRHDHEDIDVTDVIADQHRRAVFRNARGINNMHPKQRKHQQPGQKTDQKFRHQDKNVDATMAFRDSRRHENQQHRKTNKEQQQNNQRNNDQEERIQDV